LTGEITDSEIATPEIEYEAAEGSKLTDGMPVEAGTYTASITVKGVTAKVDYTITKTPSSEPDEGEEETGGADDETKNDESDDVGEPDETGDVVINSQTDDSYIKGATANISKEALLASDKFLTAEEKQELENNEKLEVTLKVSPISNISDAQRKTIAGVVSDIKATSSAIHYLDLSLMKKVGTGEATAVSDPGTDISITIGIPDEMINKNAAVSREYVIIRLHVDAAGSEVDTLHGDFDEAKQEFTFVTDRFSTYALTYIDTAKTTEAEKPTGENPTTAPSGGDDDTDLTDDAAETSSTGTLVASENKGNTSTSAANTANAASADVGASSPKTADTANIPAMAALMALAGIMALIGVKNRHTMRR
jgi:hypothetical protein